MKNMLEDVEEKVIDIPQKVEQKENNMKNERKIMIKKSGSPRGSIYDLGNCVKTEQRKKSWRDRISSNKYLKTFF